jgi:predicted GTPase
MNYLKLGWLTILTLLSLPYVLLLATGSLWLLERGWLWEWMAVSGVCMVLGWAAVHWLRKRQLLVAAIRMEPSANWPRSGHEAWEKVNALAERIQAESPPLDQPEVLVRISREVLEMVARHYYPKSRQAVLEIPVPHVLRIVELVAADLRMAFSENVPGAHILTIHDFRRLTRLASWYEPMYFLYRAAAFAVNPVSGVLRELRDLAYGQVYNASTDEVKRWAIGYCVRKAGYYAIQLYSGHLVLDDVQFQEYRTADTRRYAERAETRKERLAEEPLRILVLGQVKAGKSSLVNALFGETRAAIDVVPRTRYIDPYVLEREGIPRAIILDTAGYSGLEPAGDAFVRFREHILDCDLILLVVSARSAARAADRQLLDELRDFFQRDPDRIMPPLVVAVSFIDQLRPAQEWDPPYDLLHPKSPKAEQIRDLVEVVRRDLALAADQVVVPVSLKAGKLYNVEEGLAPAILSSATEAQRVKYLRCLRNFHQESYWQQLWQQAVNSGRVLLKAGLRWAARP